MLALAIMFSACQDADDEANDVWSAPAWYAPIVFNIRVLSPEGYSILNTSNSQFIKATYKGVTYECDKSMRAYNPEFYGLKRNNDILLFGELDGSKTYENEQIILSWGTYIKPDTITFSHTPLVFVLDNAGGPLAVEEHVYLNGKEIKSIEKGRGIGYDILTTINKDLYVTEPSPIVIEGEDNNKSGIRNMPLTVEDKNCFLTNGQRAFVLLSKLSSDARRSIVFSPLALYNALGILVNGLNENDQSDRDFLKKSMGGTHKSVSELNELYKIVNTYLSLVDPAVYASTANGLFMHNGFTLYNGFANLIAEYYQSDYALLDFNDRQSAVKEINQWSYQKSHGSIPVFMEQITPSDSAFILSTASFKANWSRGFDPARTEMAEFTKKDGTKQQVRTMHGLFHTRYMALSHLEYIELPFANQAWDMTIAIPKDVYGHGLFSGFNSIFFDTDKAEMRDVEVYLPRFFISSTTKDYVHTLEEVLSQSTNLHTALYTEMSPDMKLHPSRIDQRVNLLVDEYGCSTFAEHDGTRSATTENSSSSTRSDEPQSETVTFRANQPFFYLIRERSSGAILLLGLYNGEKSLYVD